MAIAYWIINVLFVTWNIAEGIETEKVTLFLLLILGYQITDTLRGILKELKKK